MDLLDFKKLCRLCLSQGRSLLKIFSVNDNMNMESPVQPNGLASKIMACVGIEVEPGENLPDQICNVCLNELERWVKFKELCDDANEKLIYYSTGMPPLPDEVLEKNLQKSNSDNLETSSDFGLGDVSLLEHDSLFNSIDASSDKNLVGTELITDKPFTTLFNQNSNYNNANSSKMCDGLLQMKSKETVRRENNRNKWREKYTKSSVRKYKCEVCSKVFTKFNILLQHDRIDHQDMALTEACDECDRLFISKHRLDLHYQMKHRNKLYECDICGLKSISEKSLKSHKIKHSKKFVCDICGLATISNRSLLDHKLTHVSEEERPRYACNICKQHYKNQNTLQEHLKTHLPGNLEWKCKICDKKFKNQNYLNRHKNTHLVERSCICEDCGVVLKNKTTLYIHKLTHLEKKHSCYICDKMFHTKNLLTRHMSVHTDQSNECPICNKHFSRNDTLKLHLKTHQKSEIFGCDQCGKSFSLERYLKRHLARVHKKDE